MPRYDGREKQSMWRKKVTNYLHGRCNDMANILKYAEQCREPITPASLTAARRAGELGTPFNDPVLLGYFLRSWLSSNLTDDAWAILENCPMDQGFEVWRMVN